MVLYQTIRRAATAGLTLVLMLALGTAPARGQAAGLSLVPTDAPVVIVVPNLAKFSQKIAALNRSMRLNFNQLDDALGGFKQQTGAAKGFRDDGPLVVVLTSIDGFGMAGPPIVMLMPVTDYAQFVGNYAGKADEAVTSIQMPGGAAGFARKIDGFAVMGNRKDLVEAYKAGNNAAAIQAAVGKLGGQTIAGSDAFVYVNVAAMAPSLQPKLAAMPAMLMALMARTQPGAGREFLRTEITMYTALAQAALRDMTAMVIGLDANDLGVGLTASMQLRPGAFLSDALGNGSEAGPQLAKLPNQPFIFAQATNLQGVKVKALVDQVATYLAVTQPGVAQLLGKVGPLLERCKASAGAYYVPAAGAGVMALATPTAVNAVDTTDGKAYAQANQEIILSLNNTKIPINMPVQPGDAAPAPAGGAGAAPAPAADGPNIGLTTQYVPNELQVDGVSVDRYQFQLKFNNMGVADGPGMAALGPLMAAGSTGTGYFAVSGNQVVSTASLDPILVKTALAAVKNGHGLGEVDTIVKVRQNLLPKSSIEFYISLSGIVSTVNNFLAMMGNPPIVAPADLLPIGASASFQENGVAERLFVPTSVVKFSYTTLAPLAHGMAPGAGGPPPGPGEAPGPGGAPPRQGPAPAPF